jgi:hypothetical protein
VPRSLLILVFLASLVCATLGLSSVQNSTELVTGKQIRVLVAHNPRHGEAADLILPAYQSVLAEEGVSHDTIDIFDLLDVDPQVAPRSVPALILPDALCATGLTGVARWLSAYVEAGGNLLVVYDAGSRSDKGAFQHSAGLLEIAGIQPESEDMTGASRFVSGRLRLAGPAAAAALQIPPGKLDDALFLSGYGFGPLTYPLACVSFLLPASSSAPVVLATGLTEDGRERPVIFSWRRGLGQLLYVGLPLGYLKGCSDDLPLRVVLRHFLFDMARVPHLLATPAGKGGLVVNWHVDSNADWQAVRVLREDGLLRPEVRVSVHVCAGPDLASQGDGRGFDALGGGAPALAEIAPFGELGSHGGWIHNWFADEQDQGRLPPVQVMDLIRRNRDSLAAGGRRVREYSAPDGVHPQPETSRILEELGFVAYYYTGDGSSAPNRSFYDGRMLSEHLVAFPVATFGPVASVGEMLRAPGMTPARVAAWLTAVADYCERNRTVRLVYTHPYDLASSAGASAYAEVWRAWFDDLVAREAAGRFQVRPMSEYADFLLRVATTEARFIREGNVLRVQLSHPDGLRDLAFAVPHGAYAPADTTGLRGERAGDDDIWILTGDDPAREIELVAR